MKKIILIILFFTTQPLLAATIPQALVHSRHGEEWVLSGPNYSDLKWLDSTAKPTEAEINQYKLSYDNFIVTSTQRKIDAKTEIKLSKLANKSYAQIDNYIDSNINDLASAKEVIKELAILVVAMAKRLGMSE